MLLNQRVRCCLIVISLYCAEIVNAGETQRLVLDGVSDFVSKKGGVKADVLKADRSLVEKLIEAMGKNGALDSALSKKGIDPKDFEQTIVNAWVGLRTGTIGKGIPKEKPLSVELLAAAVDSMVLLTLRSTPPGAKAYVWDKTQYAGPTEAKRWVVPGPVRIILEKEMYATVDKEIQVPEKNYVHTEELKKIQKGKHSPSKR